MIDTFRAVREDLDRMAAAMSMLEVVDQVGQERHANPRLYEMLVGAIAALRPRARPWWRRPSSSRCWPSRARLRCSTGASSCGEGDPELLVAFDLVEGGVLCRNCRRGGRSRRPALALLRRTLGGGLAGVLAEPRSPVTDEITALATEAMESHLDRRLRSVRSSQVS